jgi:hypothetical protein
MFNLILLLIAAVAVVYVLGISIFKYFTTPGTALLTAFHNSISILLSRILALSGALVGLLISAADFFGDPSLAETIKGAIDPKWVPWFVVAIAIVMNLASRRTLPKG